MSKSIKPIFLVEKTYTSLHHLIGTDIKTHRRIDNAEVLTHEGKSTIIKLSDGEVIETQNEVRTSPPCNSYEINEMKHFPFSVDLFLDIPSSKGLDVPKVKNARLLVNKGRYDIYELDGRTYKTAINNWLPESVRLLDEVNYNADEVYEFIRANDNESSFGKLFKLGKPDTNKVIEEMVDYYKQSFMRFSGVTLKKFIAYTEYLNPTNKVKYDKTYFIVFNDVLTSAELLETRNMFDCTFKTSEGDIVKNISVFDVYESPLRHLLNKTTETNKALNQKV